ncbi:sugar phosphate isomerase/epimerase family protein [Paracoccus aminophilus]|uniref:Xylose isomerase domain-containing protein n=1 Tax=Paracoccus aminophilus JCM 7686 TaxID=1367847 RepID=S5YBW4_PARAH|nr:sugar phosphate isomerase/epimerase family protein [Paracoccus aminophilus]AGT08943.1 xylose isomerase domain-containing protein [Paracoccus aminophilus JCM 7686]
MNSPQPNAPQPNASQPQARRQQIMLHSLIAKDAPMALDLRLAQELGYDGIELSGAKMRAFLAAGWSEAELAARLRPFTIPGIGFLLDIERHGTDEASLIADAEALFALAELAGAKGVQVLTGPVSLATVQRHGQGLPVEGYTGVLGLLRAEQMAITARNLARLADLAAERGLLVYLEALGWCPLNTISDQVELISRADRSNIRMVVDFWHAYVSGDTPERIAKLDKDILYGVHVCDSLAHAGGLPDEAALRNVATGEGVLPLQDWVDAVKATGYVGWWSGELFARRQHQDDSFTVAAEMKRLMEKLIL